MAVSHRGRDCCSAGEEEAEGVRGEEDEPFIGMGAKYSKRACRILVQ